MGRYMTELGLTPSARARLETKGGINGPEPPQIIFTTYYEPKPTEDASGRKPIVIEHDL